MSSRDQNDNAVSLEKLLRERLDLLIKLNVGSKRRQLLRLKEMNQLELESHLWTVDEDADDLTLHLMETCVQLPSTRFNDALKREGPAVFVHISDWTVFNEAVDEIDDIAGSRRCIEKWIRHTIREDRYRYSDRPTLLYSFPSDCRQLKTIVEWLDNHNDSQ